MKIHHFFTHDMRWEDNTALSRAIIHASKLCDENDTISIKGWICLDPAQISPPNSKRLQYQGIPSTIAFIQACESLLESTNPLGDIEVVQGTIQSTSKQLNKQKCIISCAKQYTPFAHKRQAALEKEWGDRFVCSDDHSLISPSLLFKETDKHQYIVFYHFYEFAKSFRHKWKPKKTIPSSCSVDCTHTSNQKQLKIIHKQLKSFCKAWDPKPILPTCRSLGLSILKKLSKQWKKSTYKQIRNDIHQETSMLARFLNTGVISIREVWKTLGKSMPAFERQLVWRSFYACRMDTIRNPNWKSNDSLTVNEYKSPDWNSTEYKEYWNHWTNGTTGVPIVDASMRYLQQHGWLHNRLRMIVASYLTRILRISWRHGESWFAQHLFDYDATQNHFGWKGQASLTRDSSEYFRVMNPWLQGKKYDKDAKFIKQYVPELKDVDPKIIHSWESSHSKHPNISYCKPIIPDHKKEAKESKKIWKPLISNGRID